MYVYIPVVDGKEGKMQRLFTTHDHDILEGHSIRPKRQLFRVIKVVHETPRTVLYVEPE